MKIFQEEVLSEIEKPIEKRNEKKIKFKISYGVKFKANFKPSECECWFECKNSCQVFETNKEFNKGDFVQFNCAGHHQNNWDAHFYAQNISLCVCDFVEWCMLLFDCAVDHELFELWGLNNNKNHIWDSGVVSQNHNL